MKRLFFITFLTLSVILFLSCDIDGLKEQIEELGGIEGAEKTTLTLLNLPENILPENLKEITVGDAAGGDTAESSIDGTTARVPLLSQDGGRFSGTGVYLVRLVIEKPDKTILELNDAAVEFENGSGTLDITLIEQPEEEETFTGLVILNLPENTIAESFKTVIIGNTARCEDLAAIEVDGDLARIPLQLSNGNGEFTKTGIFFVSVTIGVDSLTHLEITAKDKVAVEFVDGNGILDLDDYGGVFFLPRSLTILNMPENTIRDSFQSVDVGGVAKALLDDIKIEDATAVVPIVLNNGKEFNKSGTFYITLRVIIDSLNDIEITKDDFVICVFENGKGTLDLQNLYGCLGKGYLEGDITNKTNFAEAQVKKGTKFEMNGFFYHVITQAPMDNLYEISVISNTTVYIYAVEADSNVMNYKYVNAMRNADAFIRFRMSTVKPIYNAEKAGYYNGSDRALWKFIKMGGEWRYKTNIDEAFEIENQILSYPIGNLIYQWENVNIAPTKISLPPGIYCFEAAGAKGGDSAYYSMRFILGDDLFSKHNDIKGGDGGRIIELVSIEADKQITVYTGKAGANGSSPLAHEIIGGVMNDNIGASSSFGMPGGGGGAGSFISYDLGKPNDYFLCAGGGAGASGRVAARAFSTGNITAVKDISGGAGGGAGRGGDGGGIPVMKEVGHTERREYTSDGSTEYWDEYVVDYYYVSDRINASAGGGLDGIGNLVFGKTLTDNVQTADMFLSGSLSNPSPMYQYGVPGVKVLLTSYLSTIGIGGAPKLPALAYYPHHSDFNITSFEGGAGGNNRNAVRGGNSGNGYVRIYSLN